ncbi:peroxiredoxin [Solirhodobacter olei]|uniref:peroxiredoxin n=1 Tax=Solirhodobacter olei TaxID=2493082 RepID=UPI000FD836E9|nr:peroxiredoxin [Solirhodobacter olei]
MGLSVGDQLPEATLVAMGENGPEEVSLGSLTKGRKVVIFALPGAYTGTCTTSHVPSFIRTKADFDAKGVDDVICLSVNDPFVMDAWGKSTGASEAGIRMIGDATADFTKAVGMDFSVPSRGLVDRSKRYAMYVVDGTVEVLHAEENPGVCDLSGGESMLAAI